MANLNLKRGDKIIIKPVFQLLEEGWEPISWGWIKDRQSEMFLAHKEISYYHGIENILTESRILTVRFDTGFKDIFCIETDYHVAREAIGMVLSRKANSEVALNV